MNLCASVWGKKAMFWFAILIESSASESCVEIGFMRCVL